MIRTTRQPRRLPCCGPAQRRHALLQLAVLATAIAETFGSLLPLRSRLANADTVQIQASSDPIETRTKVQIEGVGCMGGGINDGIDKLAAAAS